MVRSLVRRIAAGLGGGLRFSLSIRPPISPAVPPAEVPRYRLFGHMGPSSPGRLLVVGPIEQELQLVLVQGDTMGYNLLDRLPRPVRSIFSILCSFGVRSRVGWTRSPCFC